METNNSNTSNSAVTNLQALATPAAVTPPPAVPPTGKARVSVYFITRNTDAQLLVASQRIIVAMTGNPAYPAPNPTLAEFTAARNAYIAVVNAAKDSRLAMAVRNQQRGTFGTLLRNLAHYVQVASNGDLPTLLGSGFTAHRRSQPVGTLPAPANLRLVRGRASGQVIARCNPVPQAGAYAWRYASATAPTTWISVDTTFAASVLLEGLVPGTQYNVQARALAKVGPSNWSDVASLMVV